MHKVFPIRFQSHLLEDETFIPSETRPTTTLSMVQVGAAELWKWSAVQRHLNWWEIPRENILKYWSTTILKVENHLLILILILWFYFEHVKIIKTSKQNKTILIIVLFLKGVVFNNLFSPIPSPLIINNQVMSSQSYPNTLFAIYFIYLFIPIYQKKEKRKKRNMHKTNN